LPAVAPTLTVSNALHPTTYQNFDLYIDALGNGRYRARVTVSPRGQTTAEFALPAAQAVQQGVRAWLATAAGASGADMISAAEALFAPLLGGAAGDLLLRCLDTAGAAAPTAIGLRVRLHLDASSEIARLPWELLPHPAVPAANGDGGGGVQVHNRRFLALDPLTPIIRYVDLDIAEQPLVSGLPLRVLAVLAAPADVAGLAPIDADAEWANLCTALAPLAERGVLQLVRAAEPSLSALGAQLSTGGFHVLHIVAHGILDERMAQGALVLCDEQGSAQLVTAQQLALLVQGQTTLRLAYLSACHGAGTTGGDAAAGVAQHLVGAGLPAVIAMQDAVEMQAAQVLARTFYGGIAGYLPVDAALGEARKAVLLDSSLHSGNTDNLGGGCDWALPVLFSRASDNVLVAAPPPAQLAQAAQADPLAAPETERKTFEPQTVLIGAGPFVMGRDPGEDVGKGESPRHTVELGAYRIGRTAVTNAQYAQFVRATRLAVAPESGWQLAAVGQIPPPGREQHPIVGVTWDDAVAYCQWLSERSTRRYRLPTEAEWERAARGVEGRVYPWGDEFDQQRCNAEPMGVGDVTAVGSFSPAGDTPEGLADMAGNIWEWTSTAWGRDAASAEYGYPYAADDGREDLNPAVGPLREYRICRGGSFRDKAERVTGSARGRQPADSRARSRGFRVVLDIG
jgi:formylglycine-generating enzyme required for sulfatase activity